MKMIRVLFAAFLLLSLCACAKQTPQDTASGAIQPEDQSITSEAKHSEAEKQTEPVQE